MGGLRTKSGLLKKRERRRRLNAGKPGTVVVMEPEGKNIQKQSRGASFGSLRGSNLRKHVAGAIVEMGFTPLDTLAYDFDARLLVEYVQSALAVHLQESMRDGVSPNDGSSHPPLEQKTLHRVRRSGSVGGARKVDRVSNKRGMRTGTLNAMWGLGPIKGNYNRASAGIKPGGDKLDKGRSIFINSDLGKGIDYGGVTGRSAKVIADAFAEFMEATKADTAGMVKVPERPRLAGGWINPQGRRLGTPRPSPGSTFDDE